MRRLPLLLLLPLLAFVPMNASDSGLHPLRTLLPEAELQVVLRGIAEPGEDVAVEARYTAQRERDVKKTRSFHLLGSPWRIGSNDLVTTLRDDSIVVNFTVKATEQGVAFAVPFHPPEGEHRTRGLHRVRIGRIEFARWSAAVPALDPAFGLSCTPAELRGTFRRDGIHAPPLQGALPLWPTLRQVDVTLNPVCRPEVSLWDSLKKHHWDGWRQTTPAAWPGGTTVIARHQDGPTVWRVHELHPLPPGDGSPYERPVVPADAIPGLGLEVYWPEGAELAFPEVRFGGSVDVLALPRAKLDARSRALLLAGATLRPGLEMLSLSVAEWKEFAALADNDPSAAVNWELKDVSDGRSVLVARRVRLREPYVFLFGAGYDEERRVAIAGVVLHPSRWNGVLPAE